MVDFMLWFLESSLLILFVLGIRKIFSGKISYRAIYALWLVVVFRFMIPVNIIPTPFGFADNMKKSLDHLELELSTAANNPLQRYRKKHQISRYKNLPTKALVIQK